MQIVDAQIHIQTAGKPSPHHLRGNYLAEDIVQAMDEARVDAAVLIPPTWDPNMNVPALDAVQRYPDRFRVMGRIHPERLESRDVLPGWRKQPGMLGLRFVFGRNPESWGEGGAAAWLWPAAEQAGLPVMIHAAGRLSLIEWIAARHPGLKLTIDHLACALTGGKDDQAFAHLPDVLALARFPNVSVKASGTPTYSSGSYPHQQLHPYLRQVFDAFGPHRMFWGTDLSRLTFHDPHQHHYVGPYGEAVTLFTEQLPWLSEADKALVMGQGLKDWIGWE